jgi:hypothetical protein
MSLKVCTRVVALAFMALAALLVPSAQASAQSTFKLAFFNIQSGKGEPALPGHPVEFYDTGNCTDASQPMNAWGVGLVQAHLIKSVGNDPSVVALGLAEAWPCGSPENVRAALGWKAKSSEHNGVGIVARYGFAGPEQWQQLDTSLNTSPTDTMWALRIPVCLDAACSRNMVVFVAHWFGAGSSKNTSYDRQAIQTADFMQRTAGSIPHVLIGDLNVFDGTTAVCSQNPNNIGLQRLRAAGYTDAWPYLHGSAEGFTGMTNRAGCGSPEGYTWKRPDYTWAPASMLPLSIERWGMEAPGDGQPSDHYGLKTEFVMPGGDVPPPDTTAPSVTLSTPVDGMTTTAGASVTISGIATDDTAVSRVEILEDGVVAHTLTTPSFSITCSAVTATAGTHTIAARAYDAAGNVNTSAISHITVDAVPAPPPSSTEIVLYAKAASAVVGNWKIVSDSSAAGGARISNPDAALAKVAAAAAAPASYFELTFNAEAGKTYRLWLRGRADKDSWANDSVYVQFSGAVNASGKAMWRIGSTDATWVNLEEDSNYGVKGWGWQDNGYGAGVLGALVRFETTGTQTIRIQPREDGLSIDQIVLSSSKYLTTAPGSTTNDATILPIDSGDVVPPPPPIAPPPPPIAPPPPVDPPPTGTDEILITAMKATVMGGTWKVIADSTASDGIAVGNPDMGAAKVATALATPVNFVEFTFTAEAGKAYRLWVRGKADKNNWANDSVFVQFTNSLNTKGAAMARIGTTDALAINLEDDANAGVAGWGWQDDGYGAGALGPVVVFATSGTQTVRVQTREDGLRVDQIVLSSAKYLTSAPGALKNDTTILK